MQNQENKAKVTYWLNGETVSKEEFGNLVGEYFKWFDGSDVKAVDYSSVEPIFNGEHKSQRQINDHLKGVLEKDSSNNSFISGFGFNTKRGGTLNYRKPSSTRHKYSGEGDFHRCPNLSTEEMKEVINNFENRKIGVKESQAVKKAPIFTYCKVNSLALEALAFRALYGHEKYKATDQDWQNFTRVPNAEQEYGEALFRHALNIGKDETEEEHLIASAWNAVARLEVFLRNKNKNLYNSK